MSKSTKIIAGLGVAAALGVAAIPVASFADTAGTHTVTVTASVAGDIVVKAATGDATATADAALTDITGSSSTGSIGFGNLGIKDQKVHANTTVIDVETNYPHGYTLSADADELTNAVGGATIGRASGEAFTTGTGDYAGTSSAWGIKVAKAVWDYSASDWSSTAGTLSNTNGYTTTDFNAIANGTVDTTGNISTNTRNKYTMSYGIGIAEGQASGTYSGEIEYTVTAQDYTAAP